MALIHSFCENVFLCQHTESSEAQMSAQTLPEPDCKLLKGSSGFANGLPK